MEVMCGEVFFFFSSRRRHTRSKRDWSSDVCSSDLSPGTGVPDAADSETELLLVESWDVAQAESSEVTTRSNRTARSAERFFTQRTYLCRCLMQAAVSGRFCGEERRPSRSQISRFERTSRAASRTGRALISRWSDHRLALQKARRHDRQNDQFTATVARAAFGDIFAW